MKLESAISTPLSLGWGDSQRIPPNIYSYLRENIYKESSASITIDRLVQHLICSMYRFLNDFILNTYLIISDLTLNDIAYEEDGIES